MGTVKPKRPNRVLGWAAKKVNGTALGQVNGILSEYVRKTRERARPATLTQEDVNEGLAGRYEDGGRERFSVMMAQQGWTELSLLDRERSWRRQAMLYAFGAFIALFAPLAWVVVSPSLFAFLMLVPGLIVPVALLAVALKADYAAWQVRSRRFGGLRDYLSSKSGS